MNKCKLHIKSSEKCAEQFCTYRCILMTKGLKISGCRFKTEVKKVDIYRKDLFIGVDYILNLGFFRCGISGGLWCDSFVELPIS